MPLVGVPWKLQ
jgi:hypothetical protein